MPGRLQINFEYNSVEDRLLLRISSEEEKHGGCVEYRFWLTRRFVFVFIKAIDQIIEDGLAANMQVSPDALETMKKFQQEAALSEADFSTSYSADAENCTLIGEVPFLASVLKVKKKSKDSYLLAILTSENEGMNITAGIDLLHTLRNMLLGSVKNAGWHQPAPEMAEDEVKTGEPSMRVS